MSGELAVFGDRCDAKNLNAQTNWDFVPFLNEAGMYDLMHKSIIKYHTDDQKTHEMGVVNFLSA